MKPIDNQQNFPSVEIFNAQISESFSRTENEVTQETKFSALLPCGPCCYRFSATRPATRCHTREKQRKSEIQTNPETRGKTPLRLLATSSPCTPASPERPASTFFFLPHISQTAQNNRATSSAPTYWICTVSYFTVLYFAATLRWQDRATCLCYIHCVDHRRYATQTRRCRTVDLHGRSTRCIQHDMAGTVDLRYATVYYCVLRGTTVEILVVSPLCRVQL